MRVFLTCLRSKRWSHKLWEDGRQKLGRGGFGVTPAFAVLKGLKTILSRWSRLADLSQVACFTPGMEQSGIIDYKQEERVGVEQKPVPFWLLPFLLKGNLLIFTFSSPD